MIPDKLGDHIDIFEDVILFQYPNGGMKGDPNLEKGATDWNWGMEGGHKNIMELIKSHQK